jgi:cellulose synthase (UDP-forming)
MKPARHKARQTFSPDVRFVRVVLASSVGLYVVFICMSLSFFVMTGPQILPFVLLITGLFYCTVLHQVFRYGASCRKVELANPAPSGALLRADAPFVTVLIPSYKEDQRVILATTLSAALLRYRNKRIVVLVDDPADSHAAQATSFGAVGDVTQLLEIPRAMTYGALHDHALTRKRLMRTYAALGDWLGNLAGQLKAARDPAFAHVDDFLIDRIIEPLRNDMQAEARRISLALRLNLADERSLLAGMFAGEITTFHRKSYVNLSVAANKAMNLNAYIGLLGGNFVITKTQHGQRLDPASADSTPDLAIPATDYVMTLDADSLVMPDYLLTMVAALEQDRTAAIAQSPYLAFPGSTAPLERIAGATTDIQYLLHQGASYFKAAYWVGANAVIRYRALCDIRQIRFENGESVQVFVQDKTVIEDTGSTIDMLHHGWHVHNHFAPLAYSATPADFGALAIQRKRWATGGLILFVDLLRAYGTKRAPLAALPELVLRAHYLIAPLIGNTAIFLLMIWSAEANQSLLWLPFFMLPYFVLYAYDLQRLGYRRRDLFGICALNLMLLPINLAGILATLRQIVTGHKGSFARTPKTVARNAVPLYSLLFNLAVPGLMLWYVSDGLAQQDYAAIVFPVLNISLYCYGIYRFMGIAELLQRLTGPPLCDPVPYPNLSHSHKREKM